MKVALQTQSRIVGHYFNYRSGLMDIHLGNRTGKAKDLPNGMAWHGMP